MGNRQGRKSESDSGGQAVERSGSKRGSGRSKKKQDAGGKNGSTGNNDVTDSNQKNKNKNDVSRKSDGKPPEVVTRNAVAVDGSMRPKMGRLSASFAAGDTRSSRTQDFSALDTTARGPLQGGGGPAKSAEVTIYRSYSTLNTDPVRLSMFDGQPSLANVKIYRRAPEAILSPSSRAASLPRGFGRTPRAAAAFAEPRTPDGLGPTFPVNGSARGRGFDWDDKRMSAPAARSATMPRLHHSFSAAPVASSAPGGYRVKTDDFPDTESIRRKLKQFESALVRSILVKFSRLSAEDQLLTVPVVIRQGRPNQVLTLRDYLEYPNSIPDDVVERSSSTGEYVLCIPPAMFTGMAHFRRERITDRAHWPSLSRDVVTCVAAEAAAEISRMFEYQVALLTGETSIGLLAEHCAERIMAFVLGDLQSPRFDCNTVVQGAVRGKRPVNPQNPASSQAPLFISVIIGMKELKWNLFEVFDKPGLRKAVLLVHDTVPAPGDDDRCPWKFYTTHSADPMLYGYRGQMVEWDFAQGCYRLNPFDEVSFREEMSWRYDDFHRLYPPYRRLFGARAMKRYYTEQARPGATPLTLVRFLLQAVHGAAYTRDSIQPVYRPLEPFTLAERDGVDLSSADVPRVLLPRRGGGGGGGPGSGGVVYETYRRPVTPGGELEVFSPSTGLVPMYPTYRRPVTPGGGELEVFSPSTGLVPMYPTPMYPTPMYSPMPRSPVDLNSSTVSEPPPRWLGYSRVVEEVTTVHAHKASHV